jgi:hypothetical protein
MFFKFPGKTTAMLSDSAPLRASMDLPQPIDPFIMALPFRNDRVSFLNE